MKLLSIIFVLALLLNAAPAAHAQDQSALLPNPGITPDSPFYFLDRWGEAFGRFFAFSREAKAAKQVEHAEERLAEAQVMADEGKDELAAEAADEYGQLISEAAANLAAAARSGKNVDAALTDLVTKATSIHLIVLAGVYEKVPEQAKPAIERAMTQSAQGQEAALNALSGAQREEAQTQQQQAEEQLDMLRQQGIPIPVTEQPTGSPSGVGSTPAGQRQQNPGPPAGVGAPTGAGQ